MHVLSHFSTRYALTRRAIFYYKVSEDWRKEEKFSFLESCQEASRVKWKPILPDATNTWLTEGLEADFGCLVPLAVKEVKAGIGGEALFRVFCRGVETTRDSWVYSFNYLDLCQNMRMTIAAYNRQVLDWSASEKTSDVDDFVSDDSSLISWSSSLKSFLKQGVVVNYSENCVRSSIYRPFCESFLYFDRNLIHRRGQWRKHLSSANE